MSIRKCRMRRRRLRSDLEDFLVLASKSVGCARLALPGLQKTLYELKLRHSFNRSGYAAGFLEAVQVEPLSVLIVDDEVEFLETLVKRLRKRKLAVNGVTSGEAALAQLQENPVDIVILDVKMPGMSGLDTLREIKKRYSLLEVIMLTGHANMEVAIAGMEIGAFDYLMKPIDIDELLYKIQDAYKRKTLNEKTGIAETRSLPG